MMLGREDGSLTGVAPWAKAAPAPGLAKAPPGPPTPKNAMEAIDKLISEGQASSSVDRPWEAAQMAPAPTLLPTLRFHDLVYGHDLGEGGFSKVRYARVINKSTTRSSWAEYAVKIISEPTMKEMGYTAAVCREIGVLRLVERFDIEPFSDLSAK